MNSPAQDVLRRFGRADWGDLVPRLLAYTHFVLSKYGMPSSPRMPAPHDYVLEAVTLVLGEDFRSDREGDRSVFRTTAAAIAMLIRKDLGHFQPESGAPVDESPVIQLASSADLMLYLASRPEVLYQVSPRRFEEVIAELLSDFGYTVHLTSTTRDDGIDIVAVGRTTPLGTDEKYLVQCKRYAADNHVGVGVVRELLGVGVRWPSTGMMIATTSTFTGPARVLATHETIRWRLHLRDYNDIGRWLHDYAKKRTNRKAVRPNA